MTSRGQPADITLYKNMKYKNTQKNNRNPSKKEKRDEVYFEWLESPPDREPGTQSHNDAHETLPVIDY